jgi:DNA polymerase-3 subunit epsilon
MYSIVDIETTGNSSKITEISIFVYDGEQVVDEFTSLVNPEQNIPPFITNLTGITNAMVRQAPKFYEIAKKVNEITKDTVFVAHSVNFDYNIIRKEFRELGFDFKRKKLCTIRLSRKLIPGLRSYSLGALCAHQSIPIRNRHRARGDAEATTQLFEQLLQKDNGTVFQNMLHPRSGHAALPPLLPREVIEELPHRTGVYYFKNEKDEIIYVGKANKIRQRVMSHFYDKSKKEINMCLETSNITYKETGSELVALLLESAEIKRIFPKYNRSQRRAEESIGLFSYEDRNGVLHLAYNRLRGLSDPIMKFQNVTACRNYLEILCNTYELCPKFCHLQSNVSSCFHFQIKKCKGVCRDEEDIGSYNERVKAAINSMQYDTEHFVVRDTGRTQDEVAFALVSNGIYRGYGYLSQKNGEAGIHDYLEALVPQRDNNDIKRILKAFMKKQELEQQDLPELAAVSFGVGSDFEASHSVH